MTSIMSSSSFEDIEAEISEMGFPMSLSDFEKSLQSEESAQQLGTMRGEGITASNYMANIRQASDLCDLKLHHAPMGHMPTSTELLNTYHENEITPLLRKLGISGHDGELSSRRTRQVPKIEEEIRLDRNMPVILNGDLFDMSNIYHSECSDEEEEDEHDDPSLPLEQRFSTIKEFQKVSHKTQTQQKHFAESGSISTQPESSKTSSSSSNTPDLSSHSTTADDATSSSGSSSSSAYSAEDQCSNEWRMEPPLLKKGKLYTPRELYEMKNTKQWKHYGVSRQ